MHHNTSYYATFFPALVNQQSFVFPFSFQISFSYFVLMEMNENLAVYSLDLVVKFEASLL